jgi:hypothetical protein
VCASCAATKQKICNSPLGTLLKNALGPLSALSGGLVPNGAGPGKQDMAAPGTVGAAAKIKQDQAEAKKRAAAVHYLGTIDCHWYPEAEAGLVAALRVDRSECVRWEAAKALARGCCCTKSTIEALAVCVSGSERDGNPAENSLRVQLVAFEALQRCVASVPQQPALEVLPRPEQPASNQASANDGLDLPPIRFSAYYEQVRAAPHAAVVENARGVIARASQRQVAVPAAPRRAGNLAEIWQRSN